MFISGRTALLPWHGDALGHYRLSISLLCQLSTGYISLGNTVMAKEQNTVLIAIINVVGFCGISLCGVLLPTLPHKLWVVFCPHCRALSLSESGSCFMAHDCQNYPQNPNHASWAVLEKLCVYFLVHLASDPQSGVSWSLGGYPLLSCSWAPSYLEEPHSQTVPDGCSIYRYRERTRAQQLKGMINMSEVIAWSTFFFNTLNTETLVLWGWIWVWEPDKRHLEIGLVI